MLFKRSGTVLVIALWVLALLSVFSAYLGVGVRQKITLLSRLEERAQLSLIAQAGVNKAIAVLNNSLSCSDCRYSPAVKKKMHNNAAQFSGVRLGGGMCEVSYPHYSGFVADMQRRFGVVDEEGKININTTDVHTLTLLIKDALHWDNEKAKKLANAIIDWREFGESELKGFYSDNYYENLQYPYPTKNGDFEVMDELLLVEGMTEEVFEKLRPFITIYGQGAVNINTASVYVLKALGMSDELIDKVTYVRRGFDGIDATDDDLIFNEAREVVDRLHEVIKLESEEIVLIRHLNRQRKLGVDSNFYSIDSHARLSHKDSALAARCVFNATDGKIEYWREVY